ncbi:hypothetical protein WMY93_019698 [Mugilogobius chulae]|uniref:Homocysteine-responsive endoplasmic reticulum-resident ubiquitin-like domain member 2 protein n=1 Tax=Mugilogobius chulae TaxID=88201 RepID=A0AAW0NF04_9GOBI
MDPGVVDNPVTLVIRAPNQKYGDQTINCFQNWTVQKLKAHLSDVYPSKPSCKDQRLVYSGKLLLDHFTLKDVLRKQDEYHMLHLVCASRTPPESPKPSSSSRSQSQQSPGPTSPSNPSSLQNGQSSPEETSEGLRQRSPYPYPHMYPGFMHRYSFITVLPTHVSWLHAQVQLHYSVTHTCILASCTGTASLQCYPHMYPGFMHRYSFITALLTHVSWLHAQVQLHYSVTHTCILASCTGTASVQRYPHMYPGFMHRYSFSTALPTHVSWLHAQVQLHYSVTHTCILATCTGTASLQCYPHMYPGFMHRYSFITALLTHVSWLHAQVQLHYSVTHTCILTSCKGTASLQRYPHMYPGFMHRYSFITALLTHVSWLHAQVQLHYSVTHTCILASCTGTASLQRYPHMYPGFMHRYSFITVLPTHVSWLHAQVQLHYSVTHTCILASCTGTASLQCYPHMYPGFMHRYSLITALPTHVSWLHAQVQLHYSVTHTCILASCTGTASLQRYPHMYPGFMHRYSFITALPTLYPDFMHRYSFITALPTHVSWLHAQVQLHYSVTHTCILTSCKGTASLQRYPHMYPGFMHSWPQMPPPPTQTQVYYHPMSLMWWQQLYAQQYFMHYHLMAASQQMRLDQTSSQSNQSGSHNHRAQADRHGNPEVQMNAQGGEVLNDEDLNRDWLDWVYTFSRAAILLSIVYFYSSFSRFVMVLVAMVVLYLHQAGWFPFNLDNDLPGDRPNQDEGEGEPQNQDLPEMDGAAEDASDEDGDSGVEGAEDPDSGPQNGFLSSTWSFIITFFMSLIPEGPANAAN